jgi:sulfur relay (sulfurtransferase) complex TusBCD TusD component (DsrE family)
MSFLDEIQIFRNSRNLNLDGNEEKLCVECDNRRGVRREKLPAFSMEHSEDRANFRQIFF